MSKTKYMAMSCDAVQFSCRMNSNGTAYVEKNGSLIEASAAEELMDVYWKAGHSVNLDGRVYPGFCSVARVA